MREDKFNDKLMELFEHLQCDVCHVGNSPSVICFGALPNKNTWLTNAFVHEIQGKNVLLQKISSVFAQKNTCDIIISLTERAYSAQEIAEKCEISKTVVEELLRRLIQANIVLTEIKNDTVIYFMSDDIGAGIMMILLGIHYIDSYCGVTLAERFC